MSPTVARGRALVVTIQRLQAAQTLTAAQRAELEAAQADLRDLVATASATDTAQVLAVLDPNAALPVYGHSAN